MFQPETYLGRVERELSFERPTLFIAHLTAAHWPYYVSDTLLGFPGQSTQTRIALPDRLQTADRMLGEMVELLQRKGALDNALVVILSDHGEASVCRMTGCSPARRDLHSGLRAPIKLNDHGHGQSVLSPSQYKVLLGFRSFGNFDAFRSSGREWDVPVTVEDIAPTILDLLQIRAIHWLPRAVTRVPAERRSVEQSRQAMTRVRFTETDLAVLPGPRRGRRGGDRSREFISCFRSCR